MFVFLTVSASSAQADSRASPQIETMFTLSLEELMSIRVVSKKEENIGQSPAIVSTYSREHLHALGLSNLRDVLHFVTSIEAIEDTNGTTVFQIRGLPSDSNQKNLFLLDGVPYWSVENGEIPIEGIPFSAIDKVEVIRGPGSVLYGTNASAGVINVVTRNEKSVDVGLLVNSENKKRLSVYSSFSVAEGIEVVLSGEVQRDEGYEYSVNNAFEIDPCFCFPETASGDNLRKLEYESLLLKNAWNNFSLTFQHVLSENAGDSNGSIYSPSTVVERGQLFSLGYKNTFDGIELDVYADLNRYAREVRTENLLGFFFLPGDGKIGFENNGTKNKRLRFGVMSDIPIQENVSLLLGVESEEREIENQKFRDDVNGANVTALTQAPYNQPFVIQPDGSILLIQESKSREHAAVSQFDYRWKEFRAVVGVRYVDNKDYGQKYSPRGALVYNLDKKSAVKLLYSEGFNSPNFSQSAGTDIFGVPQDDLVIAAEKIRSWDLAYSRTSTNHHIVLAAFRIEAVDLINNFANDSEFVRREGLEFDYRAQHRFGSVYMGVTYVGQANTQADDMAAFFTPKWLGKFGVSYVHGNHNLGSSIRAASERARVEGYELVNIEYVYSMSNTHSIGVGVRNLLDQSIMHADVRGASSREIQGEARRHFEAHLTMRF